MKTVTSEATLEINTEFCFMVAVVILHRKSRWKNAKCKITVTLSQLTSYIKMFITKQSINIHDEEIISWDPV